MLIGVGNMAKIITIFFDLDHNFDFIRIHVVLSFVARYYLLSIVNMIAYIPVTQAS